MQALWFGITALMFAMYVVLDGFDFGVGALHLSVARTDAERRQVLASIGPFWDGNEVWLLAGGGVLFLAFPHVLAAGLSGMYMAIFLVLWVLILRGIAIEFRSHLPDGMWRSFWDTTFAASSGLMPILLGAALGNVLRGVPLGEDGWFSLPLFASFSPTGALGILDWYTVTIGVFAWITIAHHGALFLAWKTDGLVRERALARARPLFVVTVAMWLVSLLATVRVAPHVFAASATRPLVWLSVVVFAAGAVVAGTARRAGHDRAAFLGSCAFVVGLLGAALASMYPTFLRSTLDPAQWSLTAHNAAAAPNSLRAGLLWWPFGLALAALYLVVLLRIHRGKTRAAADDAGY